MFSVSKIIAGPKCCPPKTWCYRFWPVQTVRNPAVNLVSILVVTKERLSSTESLASITASIKEIYCVKNVDYQFYWLPPLCLSTAPLFNTLGCSLHFLGSQQDLYIYYPLDLVAELDYQRVFCLNDTYYIGQQIDWNLDESASVSSQSTFWLQIRNAI